MFDTEITAILEEAVCERRLNLDQAKELIFSNMKCEEPPHPADVKLIEHYFLKILMDCARDELEKTFSECCKSEEFVKNFTLHSDRISTINDLVGLCIAGHYATQLELYSNLMEEQDVMQFIVNLKAYIWKNVLEKSKSGHIELEILQRLVTCFQTNSISALFHEKLEQFKRNCGSQTRPAYYLKRLMGTFKPESNSTHQLYSFLQSVKNIQSDYLSLENQLLQIIRFYLKPIEITIAESGNRSIVENIGGIIYMSQTLREIEKKLSNDPPKKSIDEYRFIAVHLFEIDCDLENSRWHGINVFIMANNINVTKKCKWNLSGLSSEECHEKAKDGTKIDKDGADGIDGHSGESSGNLMIIADQMQNIERLTIILNGGNGAKGQDGGDGMNGEDGKGISIRDLQEKFPSPVRLWGRLHNLHNVFLEICSMGTPYLTWKKGINCFVKLKLENDQEIIHSASRNFTSNCYLLCKGSVGEKGGHGGLNGLGGEGGYSGQCVAISKENRPFSINLKTIKGSDGPNGTPGQTGEYGKNGWDVGYVDYQMWTNASEFGADQKQRLRIDYSTDSSNRVYCAYQYDVLSSSVCYATITGSILQHRKLTQSEKCRERCTRQQRQQRAISTRKSAMQNNVMQRMYEHHFENGDQLVNEISQMNVESKINFNIMQRKAKAAFEEIEKIKEYSREKVSRYQVYDGKKKVKKKAVEVTTDDERLKKSQILLKIRDNAHDDNTWIELLDEEYSEDELKDIEAKFQVYQINRKIETGNSRKLHQKFALGKFQNIDKEYVSIADTYEDEELPDLNIEKYLKIDGASNSTLEKILEYTDGNESSNIELIFNDLQKCRIPTIEFDIVKNMYEQLISVQINGRTLPQLMEILNVMNEEEFTKTVNELFPSDDYKKEQRKFSQTIDSLKTKMENTTKLKSLIPIYNKELTNDNEVVLKYLIDFYKQINYVKIANCTLADIIELFIIECQESTNNDPRVHACLKFYENFLQQKQKSMEKILQIVQILSRRPLKAKWRKSNEYPNFTEIDNAGTNQEEEMEIDEKLLQKLYDLYFVKQNQMMDWHKQIDDRLLQICCNKMKSDASSLCAPLLELIGWKHQLNIVVYCQNDSGQFCYIREHFDFSPQIEHLLIDDDQIIKRLVIDQEFVRLYKLRQTLISNFQIKRQEEEYFPFNNQRYSDSDIVLYKLSKFFQDEDRLKKLSPYCIGENTILSSLLYCFMCNGCHLDSSEIFLLVNTVLECSINLDQDPELFSYIILSYSQYQWIDEIILIRLENSLRKMLQDKRTLRHHLRNIQNRSFKLVLAAKLSKDESNIDENLFVSILTLLPYVTDDSILLEGLSLSEWSLALKNSYWQHGLKSKKKFIHEDLEQFSFYLVKLENSYGHEVVDYLVNVLNESSFFSTKSLLNFVYRFYAEDTELSSDILTDFTTLNAKLTDVLGSSSKKYDAEVLIDLYRKKVGDDKKKINYTKSLMFKLGFIASEDRCIETLIEILHKSPHNNDITQLLEVIGELFKRSEDENNVLKYAIKCYNHRHAAEDSGDFCPEELVYTTCCNDETNFKKIIDVLRSEIITINGMKNSTFYLLDIVNRGIKLKRGFSLRDTQKLVVMLALMNKKNLLAQVATGEGKSLIIATLCIIKCLYGEKMDIVTSSSVLAKRDAESEPPKSNIDLYALFGVRVGHICSEDIDQRIQVFNNCDVIYGDLSSFQRDYLLDRFYGKNILGSRIFKNVIVDEVDSMLLDNGNNMLYLSHDIPNMDKLQSLFVFLWRSVNRPINSIEDLNDFYDNTAIKQSVIADLYGMVMRDEVEDKVWKVLIESKTIGEDGRLLINLKDYTQLVKNFRFSLPKTENRLIFLLNNIAVRQRMVKIPEDLYKFVERHLDKFIDNAKHALFMNVGVDYVIDVDRTGLDPDLNPKIIIIDKNTGTDQSSSQWHEGLHQFLQIKHGCKLSLMSLKAVFISNVSYLKLYENLYGLSGTLGSNQEKELLNELYTVDLIKIPTSKPKHFCEEKAVISGYLEQWIDNIYGEIKKKLLQQRSVLIIGETVKDVDYIAKHLIKRATADEKDNPNSQIYRNLKAPYIYKREHDEFVFGQGNAYLTCGKVIIATNLAGRGTDIKLEKELIKAGGLHVIITFLPTNCRVEEQAYGRAARCGEEGSGQLIIIGNEENGGSYSSKIFQLKSARDIDELQRLKMVKKFYDERITIEENCFAKFKSHYENLHREMEQREYTKEMTKLLMDSFLDKWAFWLDENSQLIESQVANSTKQEKLFHSLDDFLRPISLQFDHWLDSPNQFLKLGNHYVKNKQYQHARNYFEKIINQYSYYLAEALYYSSVITIKEHGCKLLRKTGPEFQQLKKDLIMARGLFEERISDCSNDQAIVESFKKHETNILIYIEAFSEQQKTISQIYSLFINSIDDILGHSVSYDAFVNFQLTEILAYDAFIELQQQGILTNSKTSTVYSDDALTDIAMEYGVSPTILRNHLRENSIVTNESLAKVIDLPNVEEFWSLLKGKGILENEMEFLVINKEKLELIQPTSIKTSVTSAKVNIQLDQVKPTEIFQYPLNKEQENIFCSKAKLYDQLGTQCMFYLQTRGICSINRKANINSKEIEKRQQFSKFDSIQLSDLVNIKISEDDSIAILEILSEPHVGVLEELPNGKYTLRDNIDCSLLPSCYKDVVGAILNSKFAYRLAYVHLQEYYKQVKTNSEADVKLKFQFRLTSNPYQQLIFDLINKSVIEDVHVVYDKFKSADFKEILNNVRNSYAQHLGRLKEQENLDFISKALDQLSCGMGKLETPDCFFSTLEGTLKAQHNSSIVEASWFSLNGMEDLIVLQEQAYSWKFWRNVLIVSTMALAQITFGALIEIWTAGIGTYAASFLINEGISDIFFVAGCLCNGHMTMASYWQHKKWSMAISAVSCGVGALLSRGTKLSRIGYKVAGPFRAEGGKRIAEMTGRRLAESIGTGTIAKETLKRVGCKVIEGAAYGFAQGAVDHVITNHLHGLCDTIQKTMVSDVHKLFEMDNLNQTILDAFDKMGEKKARLLMDQVTRECFEKTSIQSTILAHCSCLCGSILRGISDAMRKTNSTDGSSSVLQFMKILSKLQLFLRACGAYNELEKMKDSTATFLKKANTMIKSELENHSSSTPSNNPSQASQRSTKVLRDQTMQQWKQTIIETSNQVIATNIIAPILSDGANRLVGIVGNSIKKTYHSFKEQKYRNQFELHKKEFDEKIKEDKANTEKYQKELETYYKALMNILSKTKDSRLFADIIRENVPMDMVCAKACTHAVDRIMHLLKIVDGEKKYTGIRIVINGTDGSSHEYSSSADPSHTISLTLDNNHFRVSGYGNVETTQNNCLYEALISQIPELKTVFTNGTGFREHLSNYIESDEKLQHIIAQGWHRFSIEKGSYGGAFKEKKYDPKILFDENVKNVEQLLKRFFNSNSHLSDEIRKESEQCLKDIKQIATSDLRGQEASKRIKQIVQNFKDSLIQKSDNNVNLTELKEMFSTFSVRVTQTVSDDYLITLEEFQTKARLADRSPLDPTAVHIADREDLTKDDIELKRLAEKNTKPRNDPNLIAGVIHARINKEVPEAERRFNTVAVGIHGKDVYVAFNHVGISDGQNTFEVNDEKCKEITKWLRSKKLLSNEGKVVFLKGKLSPTTRDASRAPHAELQIMSFAKRNEILGGGKSWRIGASKPPCLCCSLAMRKYNIDHKIYGNANTSPKNWLSDSQIKVRRQKAWKFNKRKTPK